ncbi:hemolysin family protein [Spirilliplanes yamanashiensis]|uniref:Membrane protein n=1 Tax=Spirilliplanes yamanashiensis TaxID=42233 RepID=A0A8J3Y577_9ACTN|nr:hemolysin family protein [Spirilliplanes yamanashiensis]MDP9819594.1 CBS domain containing-hemolysin-like protein [Spirilliplanes yamanashiensis]GIJ01585.1 membrane protein [Spirilliplanes yamanashiensis]
MSTTWAAVVSLLLLALNGFFVAAEFALVASKRYRLEHAAAGGSRAARAALDGSRELSLMLAGAQLGITLCSLGLGALAEPALEHLISPALAAVGLPEAPSHVVAFLIALLIVTFLHLVLGEMVPKSWAISDPERAATLLALPFRAFARVARPALTALNAMANGLLRLVKVRPQDQLAQVHGPEELQLLLEESRDQGTLPREQQELLSSMLRLQRTTLADVLVPDEELVTVEAHSSAAEIEELSRACGRSRLAVAGGDGAVTGVVHIRDAVRATTTGRPATAAQLMTAPFVLGADVTVTDAVTAMRGARAQLALVERAGARVGFVALEDLLEQVIGEFDDETDPVPSGRRMR